MKKLADAFASNPWIYGALSALLISLLYYAYSRTLPMRREDVNRSTAKVAAAAIIVNGVLAYLVGMGGNEQISTEPFVAQA